jgi:hypothetical protein
VEIPLVPSAALAVDRIPLVPSAALADAATASGCCASRHSEGRWLTFLQCMCHKARCSSHRIEPDDDMHNMTRAALATYFSLLVKGAPALPSLLKD